MPCLYTRSQSTALCQIHRHLNNQQPTTTFPPTVSHLLQIHFEKFSPVIAICGEFAGFIPGLLFRVYGNIITDFSARGVSKPHWNFLFDRSLNHASVDLPSRSQDLNLYSFECLHFFLVPIWSAWANSLPVANPAIINPSNNKFFIMVILEVLMNFED